MFGLLAGNWCFYVLIVMNAILFPATFNWSRWKQCNIKWVGWMATNIAWLWVGHWNSYSSTIGRARCKYRGRLVVTFAQNSFILRQYTTLIIVLLCLPILYLQHQFLAAKIYKFSIRALMIFARIAMEAFSDGPHGSLEVCKLLSWFCSS